MDVVIVDTAGRLQIDKTMIDELKEVKRALNPTEVLLVVDAMNGQEAAGRPGSLESLQQLVEVARNPAANPATLFAIFVREDNTRQATQHKLSLLKHFKNSTADFETVRDIKENLCYLSYDYKREYQLGLETTILAKNYTVRFEFY
ncbi:hypothetical protein LOK49_LG04G00170 [Camellia lanceoleosa]|uniref:Uncharacterized protein n=1 Tax=Camellia lanceoleosa TaxID=1840588 RepID=A0ACC0I525_9ERIC|nr:hypothetical protein LOK49_LG04G00170 [Camellia lanceoleosa]